MISRAALLTLLAVSAAAPARADLSGRVVGVVDGDTIDVLRDGRPSGEKPQRVRLAGVDCPEKAQPYGTRARQATAELAFGADVRVLEKESDRYGRTVGEVVLGDGTTLNRELVRRGWAWWYRQYSKDRALGDLEVVARMERRGLWADSQPVPPWEWRARQRGQRYAGRGEGASGGERARWNPPARRHRETPPWRWLRGLTLARPVVDPASPGISWSMDATALEECCRPLLIGWIAAAVPARGLPFS